MNMKIETQIELLKTVDKMRLFRYLIQHNRFAKNRKKSIALIKAFDNSKRLIQTNSHFEDYTSNISLYFAMLKRKHKILEEELK